MNEENTRVETGNISNFGKQEKFKDILAEMVADIRNGNVAQHGLIKSSPSHNSFSVPEKSSRTGHRPK